MTNGTDYAEFVPKLNPSENLTQGDVVGVFSGKATKTTANAHGYYVVSGTSAGFIGGAGNLFEAVAVVRNGTREVKQAVKSDYTGSGAVPIAFVGQIRAKVRGAVNAGDWIIPSGDNDGTAVAVSIESVNSMPVLTRIMKQKIGVAWETNANAGVKLVNIAVGK